MAENEYIDLGHHTQWRRLRRALKDPTCGPDDLLAAAEGDMEGMCRKIPGVLRKSPPLMLLLEPALNSHAQAQAVLAAFTERSLATYVRDALKLTRSAAPGEVAAVVTRRILERLVDQFALRASKQEHYRDQATRDALVARVAERFAVYEGDLRASIEASLRGSAIKAFKPRTSPKPRMSAKQLLGFSVAAKPPGGRHAS
ncbi:hypothetical protein [Lysobacter enzymogenes]|uniref:hypothetical protein n=1 Tax=Lysobacter enzymogenes TaxID=69 RepID=UPI000942B47A|nr:hypothetical protein [Lysobacter enzymogenes]